MRPRRPTVMLCLAFGLLALYVLGIPVSVSWLHRRLAIDPAIDTETADVQAIVVLGGGRRSDAPEYGGDTLSPTSLERARYAALLYRKLEVPLLVSGGSANGRRVPESEIMARVFENEFGVPVRWVEANSRDTFENARFSAALLQSEGIGRIALVTHALHMVRASASFRRAGLEVVPAPMGYYRSGEQGLAAWIPSPVALYQSALAVHELLGRVWYRWRDSRRPGI